MLCSLLEIKKLNHLKTHPLYGNIFETFCVSELIKQNFNKNLKINFFFWRDKQGREIDLIYQLNEKIYSIEFKSAVTFNEVLIKNLLDFQKITKQNLVKKLYFAGENQFVFKGIEINSWKKINL